MDMKKILQALDSVRASPVTHGSEDMKKFISVVKGSGPEKADSFKDSEQTEGVAGAQKCWPGHRKVGTKPGTGKNAGKRVNDCEKIGSKKNEGLSFADYVGLVEAKKGLYYNVNKRKKAGTSRPASSPKAPTAQAWKDAAKTAKK